MHKKKPTASEKARMLRKYIYILTSNEKRFPARYRKSITAKIENQADDIVTLIREGDEIYPDSKPSYDEKLLCYKKALAVSRSLDTNLMDIYEMPYFKISGNQLENLSRDITIVTSMLTNLIKATRKPEYD